MAHNMRTPNEHLVFVKNVPSDLAKKNAIPKLFAQYNPIGFKNVYPHSNITTIVVTFATRREAAHAQKETDQTRLENVILRVEGYKKIQSVRYLRDKGQAIRPLGTVEEYDTEDSEEYHAEYEPPAYNPPPELVAAKDPKIAPTGITWAHIAGNQRGAVQPVVSTIQETDEEEKDEQDDKQDNEQDEGQDKDTPPKTPTVTPRMPVAVPDITWTPKRTADGMPSLMSQNPLLPPTPPIFSLSNRTIVPPTLLPNTPRETILAPSTSSDEGEWAAHGPYEPLPALPSQKNRTIVPARPGAFYNAQYDAEVEHKVKMEGVSDWAQKSTGIQAASAWEPIDTTERIRQRHCHDCAFCKKRSS
jgi:hypothetical protein